MSEKEPKPCPYCHSIKNEWGTCSWHCLTCEHAGTNKDCLKSCDYKRVEPEPKRVMIPDDEFNRYPFKQAKRKKEKPYLSCTWYPDQCNAVGCDCGQGPCRDYKED